MLFFIQHILISLKFKLMSIFQRSLMWILKVNCNRNRKLTVSSIMDFKWMLINCNERFRKTLVNLEFNLLDHEREILLLHRVSR